MHQIHQIGKACKARKARKARKTRKIRKIRKILLFDDKQLSTLARLRLQRDVPAIEAHLRKMIRDVQYGS